MNHQDPVENRPVLPDAAQRNRFVREVDCNFSVIAPAGVGKTTAIVDRVVQIAETDGGRPEPWLPKLAVVTYTVKAAEEMLLRTRNQLSKKRVSPQVMANLSKAYFGTIHSFCLDLVRKYGLSLGLSANMKIVEDDNVLYIKFLRELKSIGNLVPETVSRPLFRHLSVHKLTQLARKIDSSGTPEQLVPPGPFPVIAPDELLAFEPDKRNQATVPEGQNILRQWLVKFRASQQKYPYLPLPQYDKGGKKFKDLWKATFAPVQDWLSEASLYLARAVAGEYRAYRLEQNVATYEDIISYARALLAHPPTAEMIRSFGYRIILDEAQDTDAGQFEVLLEVSRPVSAHNRWIDEESNPPGNGHFCMVGDPQQSIYEDRADLSFYRWIHERLIRTQCAESALFSVTMRCDRKIVDFVNATFPAILNGSDENSAGQVPFVPLQARPNTTLGQVLKYQPQITATESFSSQDHLLFAYASDMAAWLSGMTLEKLQARDWSQVAILCPRKMLLETVARAMKRTGLQAQIQSRAERNFENPAYAWLTALTTVMAQPDNSFEIVGILREWFCVSDHDLALFSNRKGPAAFQIIKETAGAGPVNEALNELSQLYCRIRFMPLRDAIVTMVRATALSSFLTVLPGYDSNELDEQMSRLLIHSAEAELDRMDLTAFACQLREGLDKPAMSGNPLPGHIQLITCHKAKGLGWDAVIIPFTGKKIAFPNESYPRIHKLGSGKKIEERVLLESGQEPDIWKNQRINKRQEGLERLLYVAMTRARRTLVLFDDSFLFEKKKNQPSFTSCLKGHEDDVNYSTFSSLTESVHNEPGPDAAKENPHNGKHALEQKERASRLHSNATDVDPLDLSYTSRLIARATVIRKTPSSLKIDYDRNQEEPDRSFPYLDPQFDEELRMQKGADYGNWWHFLMEAIPWRKSAAIWNQVFEEQLPECPDAIRGRREWELFIKSDLSCIIKGNPWRVKTEVPFLWKANDNLAFEGFIDWLAQNRQNRQLMLVDWKTDTILQESDRYALEQLRKRYSTQLTIYARAILSMQSGPLRLLLYSTRAGGHIELTDLL